MRGYYRDEDYGIIRDLVIWFVDLVKQMLPCILGIVLIFAGNYIRDYESDMDRAALQSFLQSLNKEQYMSANSFVSTVPDRVTVHHLEKESYRTYEVEASAGSYFFKGTVSYGELKAPLQYVQNENFWDKGVVITFAGEVIAVLGLAMVLVMRFVLGVRSSEEFKFYYTYCRGR